jgi:hypothetical protein
VNTLFIIFVGDPEEERRVWEDERFGDHCLNRTCSGTTKSEGWIQENDIFENDRSRFCLYKFETLFSLRKLIFNFSLTYQN